MATDDDKVLVSREYLNDVLEGATDEVGNALRAALDAPEATNLIQMAKRSGWEEGFGQGASWGMRYMGDEPDLDRPRNPHEEGL